MNLPTSPTSASSPFGVSLGTLALLALLAASSGNGRAQVFIQNANVGGTYNDTSGNSYPGSPTTIIRVTGAGSVYNGQNISGSTVGNSIYGAQAQNGGTINFTITTSFSTVGSSAHGFFATGVGSGITAGLVSLNTTGASAYGINAADAGATITTGAAVITTAGNAAFGVNVGNGASVAIGNGSSITTTGVGATGVQLVAGTVNLGTGSTVNVTGNSSSGINASGAGSTVTATGLTINTNVTSNGTGLSLGAGALANLSGVTIIHTGGAGISASGATVNILGTANIDVDGAGIGVNLASGAGANLGTGSLITTENGTGLSLRTNATTTAANLTVVTNFSGQNLVPLFTGLAEYPVLAGIDPLDLDHPSDPLNLAAYLIASPAKGIDMITGTLTLTGTTRITAGSVGLYVSNATATLTGPTIINAGPGGIDNTFMDGVHVTGGGNATLNGDIEVNVDSVAGSGVYANGSGALATLISSAPIRVTLENDRNLNINNVNEASALRASAGTVNVTGDVVLVANQGRGYGLWAGDNAGSTINIAGNTTIITHGREGFGIRLDDGAINLTGNLDITTDGAAPDSLGGAGAAGIRGIKGTLGVSGSTRIQTVGGVTPVGSNILTQTRESAYGIWNTSASRLAGNGAQMTFGGPVTVSTQGDAAHGIYNDTNSGGLLFQGPVNITTSGNEGSVTWYRANTSSPGINETVGAWGVNSALSGTTTFQGPLSITTSGTGSGGVRSIGGLVDVRNGLNVTTLGQEAHGIYASGTTTPVVRNGTIQIAGPASIDVLGDGAYGILADQAGRIDINDGVRIRIGDLSSRSVRATGSSIINGVGHFDVIGDMEVDQAAQVALRMNSASLFSGRTTWNPSDPAAGSLDFQLRQNSQWQMTGDSNLRNLLLQDSSVLYGTVGDFKRLTVRGNFFGNNGLLGMNTNLRALRGDFLAIEGTSSGSHHVLVANSGGAPTGPGQALKIISTTDGAAQFRLINPKERVEAGMYAYRLGKGDGKGNIPDRNDWYLYNRTGDGPEPTPTPNPNPGPTPNPDPAPSGGGSSGGGLPELSTAGQAIVDTSGALATTWFSQLDMLHKRMGELRLNTPALEPSPVPADGKAIADKKTFAPLEVSTTRSDIWLRGYGQQINANTQLTGAGFTEYLWGTDLGVDKGWRLGRGWLYTGLYGGYGEAYRQFGGPANGETKTIYGGLYGTYLWDNGWYVDGVAKLNWFENSFTAYDNLGGKIDGRYQNWGLGFSMEGGKRFQIGDGWFVEPQGQAAYVYLTSAKYTAGNGTDVDIAGNNLWQLRVGGLAGREISLGSLGMLQPYVKAYFVEAVSSGGQLRADGGTWRPSLDGPRVEGGAGLAWAFNQNVQVYADYEMAAGTAYTKPWGANLGFRYQW